MTRIPWALSLLIAGAACGAPLAAPTAPAPAPGTVVGKARLRCKAGSRWEAERRECVSPDGTGSSASAGSPALRPADPPSPVATE